MSEENKNLQFRIFHNSEAVPHHCVAHLDLEIAQLKESLDRGTTNELNLIQSFPTGGSISFTVSMEEEKMLPTPSEHIFGRGNKVERCFFIKGHKFMKTYFNEPTFCKTCDNLIWGITEVQQNGLRCVNCKMAVHKRCYSMVLVECPKSLNPECEDKKGLLLKNSHDFRETKVNREDS